MAKGFKLRISLPSLRICRSKKPSSMPKSPSAATQMFSPVNPKTPEITYRKLPAPPPSTPNHPLSKPNLSKVLSFGSSGWVSKLSTSYVSTLCNIDSSAYRMIKDYDNLQKPCNSPANSEAFDESIIIWPVDPFNTEKDKNSKDFATSPGMSFSSAYNNWFNSEDYDQQNDEESEGVFCSCSSLDSSYDCGYSFSSISEKPTNGSKRKKKNAKVRRLKRYASNGWKYGGDQRMTIAARPEAAQSEFFGRLMPCVVEGKVNESYAVMKKSLDPYKDFKKSMLEMILEKQIIEAEELEKLLMCFLSLNAREHHAVIVEAFTEVWEELFCKSDSWA